MTRILIPSPTAATNCTMAPRTRRSAEDIRHACMSAIACSSLGNRNVSITDIAIAYLDTLREIGRLTKRAGINTELMAEDLRAIRDICEKATGLEFEELT